MPVKAIRKEHVRHFLEEVMKLPNSTFLPAEQRKASVAELQRLGEALPKITAATVDRHLNAIKACLRWCEAQRIVDHAPIGGL